MERSQNKYLKYVAYCCALLIIFLGILFLIGWHTGSLAILQLPPSTQIFPYYAAWNLIFAGLAIFGMYLPGRYSFHLGFASLMIFTSIIAIVEFLLGVSILTPPFKTDIPYQMTMESAIGYIWAGIALFYWVPFYRSSFKHTLPFFMSVILVVGGTLLLGSYLVKTHTFFISLDAGNFNFYGVFAMILFGLSLLCSCFYFKTMPELTWWKSIPVLVAIAFVFFAVLVTTIFTLERGAAIRELLEYKKNSIEGFSGRYTFTEFKKAAPDNFLIYSFFLFLGEEPILAVNEVAHLGVEEWRTEGHLTLEGVEYRFCLYPTPALKEIFLNQTVIYLILTGGLTIAACMGSLVLLWQQSRLQLAVNTGLQLELKKALDAQNRILSASEIGTWKWSIADDRVTGDSRMSTLFGLKNQKFEGACQDFIAKLEPEYQDYLQHCKELSLQNGKPYEATIPIQWPDGSAHYILSKGQVVYDKQGAPLYLEGISWNITNIKRAQLFLEVSEAVAKLFAEQKPLGVTTREMIAILKRAFGFEVLAVWMLDENKEALECIAVNQTESLDLSAFKKTKILKGRQMAGMVWSTLRPFWSRDIREQPGFDITKTEQLQGGLAVPLFEGDHLLGVLELYQTWPLVEELNTVYLDFMGSLGSGLGQYLQRRAAEKNQAELAAIVTHTHEGMYSLTKEGVVKSWNPGAEAIFGWTREEMVGKKIKKLFSEEDLEQFFKKAEKGQNVESEEIEIVRSNGSKVWVNKTTSVMRDKYQTIEGCCVVIEDISSRRELEKSKHEFISIIGHELRTPLTSIHGAIGLLRADPSQSGKVKELLDVAYRNSDRLIYLINDIMTVEKFELGVLKFDLRQVPIDEVVDDALETSKSLAEKAFITLVKKSNCSPGVLVQVEKMKLIQVLLNFLSNAIKFSPQGAIILVTVEEKEKRVRVSVQDMGRGIPEDFKSKIFGKFTQANMGSAREVQGTGLGLYISKTMIESMGGIIGFTSEPGKGSTFYFELPVVGEGE